MKSVCFSFANPSTSSAAISSSPFLTEEEISRAWYSAEELQQFVLNARQETRQLILSRQQDASLASETQEGNSEDCRGSFRRNRPLLNNTMRRVEEDDREEEEQCYRGLEHRASLDRAERKFLSVRAVLEVQKQLQKSSMAKSRCSILVSNISLRFTRAAVEEARMRGWADFLEAHKVYECHSSSIVPTSPSRKRSRLSCSADDFLADAATSGEQAYLSEGRKVRTRVVAS